MEQRIILMKRVQLATIFLTCLLGTLPIVVSAQPYIISTDGSEVTDQKTGLIWRRCAEGMVLSGDTCTGTAHLFTDQEAVEHGDTQAKSTGIAWRLPNVRELASIVEKSLRNPSIDSRAFPATPSHWFWTSTPFVDANYVGAWLVSFDNGFVLSYRFSGFGYHVRLVRASQ
jgi:hypothetical protein